MLSDKELKEIIDKDRLTDVEMLSVIQRYIYDIRGIDVGTIVRPTGLPTVINMSLITDLELMNACYNKAFGYYKEKE